MTVNILGNVADKEPLEIQYGRRGLPTDVLIHRPPLPEEADFTDPDDIIVDVADFHGSRAGRNL